MGITIHYKGKLNNPALIIPFIEELCDIANEMEWKYSIIDDLDSEKTSQSAKGNIEDTVSLRGLMMEMHEKAESLSFLFDKNGVLRNPASMSFESYDGEHSYNIFIKTQFAPVDVHITVIKLLKYLKKKYISNLEVFDEGMYWETEDKELLSENYYIVKNLTDKVEWHLTHIETGENESPESLADKIEEVLKKKFGFEQKD